MLNKLEHQIILIISKCNSNGPKTWDSYDTNFEIYIYQPTLLLITCKKLQIKQLRPFQLKEKIHKEYCLVDRITIEYRPGKWREIRSETDCGAIEIYSERISEVMRGRRASFPR